MPDLVTANIPNHYPSATVLDSWYELSVLPRSFRYLPGCPSKKALLSVSPIIIQAGRPTLSTELNALPTPPTHPRQQLRH